MSDVAKSVDKLTNCGLIVISAITTLLSFNTLHEYVSLQYPAEWGGWLAFACALGIGIGFYLFWLWAFLTIPEAKKEIRQKSCGLVVGGLILIFVASTQTNFQTMFAGTAQLKEQQSKVTELKEFSDRAQNIARSFLSLETVIRLAGNTFKRNSDQENCCGMLSGIPGPGGVTIMFDEHALKAQDMADEIASSRPRINANIEQIIQITSEMVVIIGDPALKQSKREADFSEALDNLRALTIQLTQDLSITALRSFISDLTGEPIMPALSRNPESARMQRIALQNSLPIILNNVAKSLDAPLEDIEKIAAIEPPVFGFLTDSELIRKHWRGGVNVLAIAIAVDFLPLILLGFACFKEDSKRKDMANNDLACIGDLTMKEIKQLSLGMREVAQFSREFQHMQKGSQKIDDSNHVWSQEPDA